MFSRVIRDFQHPQMSALHTDANAVQFCDVWVHLADVLQKLLHVFIIVMAEFLRFNEVDLFSVGIILDFVDMLKQGFQSVRFLWYTVVMTCRGRGLSGA